VTLQVSRSASSSRCGGWRSVHDTDALSESSRDSAEPG
jgi:hypothetical protein